MFNTTLNNSLTKDLITFCLNSKKGKKRSHVTRLYMYKKLENLLTNEDDKTKKILAVSGSANLARILGLKQAEVYNSSYPDCNLSDLNYEDNFFDFCVSDQVLEHVAENPYKAFEESIRVVKQGGYICHTTCFINPIHGGKAFDDYWRFTPKALALMSKPYNLKIVEVNGWGNQEVWSYIQMSFRGHKIPEDPDNPIYQLAMRNERSWYIVTWILAQVQ
ncbi:methyltransferase domain-containing protein [Okeania sp. SIO2C2]|uniref:methyltransferase domain-containing protein n=1 Tax=Okeania sp. SIO2C2 TaxID=2607787 RepID=UPI00257A0E30|nr:methyltransferase domain-containing protein [Okeania sp. SIO2C2]